MREPIQLVLPTPFAVGPVNAWLLLGDEPALVDVGPRTGEAWEALVAGLAANGLQPRDLRHIFITHAHADHYGNAARLKEAAPEADLYAPDVAHARPMLLDDEEEWARQSDFMRRALLASGLQETIAGQSGVYLARLQRVSCAAPVTRWVYPGDYLSFGGIAWQVVGLPGHSMTQVGLWQRDQALFIAADHLLPHISSNALLEPPAPGERRRPRALPHYIDSLHWTADLPTQRVFPGHGLPFTDQLPLVTRRLQGIEERVGILQGALLQQPRSVIGLVAELFPQLDPDQLFLAVSEVVGHLDVLEMRGQVAFRGETVREYYPIRSE